MPYANENTPAGQQEHAHDAYMEGADGLPVQDDLDDRVDTANATHDPVANDELTTELNVRTVTSPQGIVYTSYDGGNIIEYADTVSPITSMEDLVRDRLASDDLFNTGFGNADPVIDGAPTEFLDPLVLIEASKLTGEKLF